MLIVLWKVVPQPCTGEEKVYVRVDRGLGNLAAVFTVSCHFVDWDELIMGISMAQALAWTRIMSLNLALRSERG